VGAAPRGAAGGLGCEDDGVRTLDNDPAVIRGLLTTPATWAVVGLSANRSRAAYGIARFLQAELGMRVVPVHPSAGSVLGAGGYARLADVPDDQPVDVVDCFVNSAKVGAVVDDAIAEKDRLGIAAVWMQLGVVDEAAADRARRAGLAVVMDTCPRIEYPRLHGGDGAEAVVG
jgi:predicted CoA-binding protein